MNGVLIYLFGFAGCGKLTIAKAIQARYDCILVDNHLINNVIFSLIDPDGKTKLPHKVWEGEERDQKAFFDIVELARDRNALFFPVRLSISPHELSRRVVSPGRAERFKETDPAAARKKAQEREVFKPHGFRVLEIDITALAPEKVAEMILLELDNKLAR